MNKSALFSLFLILLVQSTFSNPQEDKPDHISEWFRHGARSPGDAYDHTWPSNIKGHLLPIGMRQEYILGQIIGKKYAHLFGDFYNYSSTYVLSDTTPNCVLSAQAHLQGIFEGKGPALNVPADVAVPPYQDPEVQKIAESLSESAAIPHNFTPFYVNIASTEFQLLIFQAIYVKYCPNFPIWEAENLKSNTTKKDWALFTEAVAYLNAHLDANSQITNIVDLYTFGDALVADLATQHPLIAGLENQTALILNLTNAYEISEFLRAWQQPIQRQLFSYNSIQEMLNQLSYFRSGVGYNTTALYACHDLNLMGILTVFGIVNEECLVQNFMDQLNNRPLSHPACHYPWFASSFIIELYNKTETPYVRIFYNNVEVFLCHQNQSCTYDEFVFFAHNATGNLTFATFQQGCGETPSPSVSKAENLVMSSMVSAEEELVKQNLYLKYALAVLAVICTALCYKSFGAQRKNKEAQGSEESFMRYTNVNGEKVVYA